MAQRDEIKALREEVAELRKQITALLDLERIIAKQPTYVPYVPASIPYPSWPYSPTITWSSSDSGTVS